MTHKTMNKFSPEVRARAVKERSYDRSYVSVAQQFHLSKKFHRSYR